MVETVGIPVGRARQTYLRGEVYLVPASLAATWIAEEKAVDPAKPPTCDQCGAVAETPTLLARHIEANHRQPEEAPATARPVTMPPGAVQCPHCKLWAESHELLDRHVAANHSPKSSTAAATKPPKEG